MARLIGGFIMAALLCGLAGPARAADDKDASAVIDKAIKALGGEEKLKPLGICTWKAKGKINFQGNEGDVAVTVTTEGLDHSRQDIDLDFGGMMVKGVIVLNGDKAWRKFGDMLMELGKDEVATSKRGVYLQVVPMLMLPLKGKEFKTALAGEEKVGDKAAVVLKITPPQGEDFKLYLDKDSGLPIKLVAKVKGFMGEDVTQETTYGDYKEMAGIKKATKLETKRDGMKFQDFTVNELKALDKVDPATFAEPK
jgi:hypothetical protein